MCEERRVKLHDTSDLYRLLSLIRILMLWMEDVVRQINTQEKARCVRVARKKFFWGFLKKFFLKNQTVFFFQE